MQPQPWGHRQADGTQLPVRGGPLGRPPPCHRRRRHAAIRPPRGASPVASPPRSRISHGKSSTRPTGCASFGRVAAAPRRSTGAVAAGSAGAAPPGAPPPLAGGPLVGAERAAGTPAAAAAGGAWGKPRGWGRGGTPTPTGGTPPARGRRGRRPRAARARRFVPPAGRGGSGPRSAAPAGRGGAGPRSAAPAAPTCPRRGVARRAPTRAPSPANAAARRVTVAPPRNGRRGVTARGACRKAGHQPTAAAAGG